MKKIIENIILVNFIILSVILYAQNTNHTVKINIPEVALLSIQKPNNQQLIEIIPVINEAGDDISFKTSQNEIWINYSSIIGSKSNPSRFIYLQITEGTLPTGLDLVLDVSNDYALGEGKLGIPIEQSVISSNQPTRIIDHIGSCYTGVGNNKGHRVSYSIQKNNKFNSQWLTDNNTSASLQLTYTLSDN